MALVNLTTQELVKQWWSQSGGQNLTSDRLIDIEIGSVSAVILAYLARSTLAFQVVNEIRDGIGNNKMLLKRWPVLSVNILSLSSFGIPVTTIPPASATSGGYTVTPVWDGVPPGQPQFISVFGYSFPRSQANVTINYNAGYATLNEAQTIPNDTEYQIVPSQPYGIISGNIHVAYSNGTLLTAVAKSVTPTVGQYVPPDPLSGAQATNYYQFAAADAGASILLSYSYIPQGIEQAARELVLERLSYRTRIAMQSKGLAGQETTSYKLTFLPDWIKNSLQPYKQIMGT